MSVSRPAVHPVEVSPPADANPENLPRVRMKDIQGTPGTHGGLALRLLQFAFGVAAIGFMASANDFSSVTAFCYLVAAVTLQCIWSLSLAFLDMYALFVKRSLRNPHVVCFFTVGDGITSTLTFAAACSSAGITVLISNDLNNCAQNHCGRFETATAMAFLSWFVVTPSYLLNFWTMASSSR
ncbi:CASP-like protein 5A1 [Wolffia australiana]